MDVKSNNKNPKKVFGSFSKTHYKVDSNLVSSTVNALKANLQSRIPSVKENELKMTIMRGVTDTTHGTKVENKESWRNNAEIFDNIVGDQSKPGILSKKYSISVGWRVKYRSIHNHT
jgi:hypothetical protein